MSDFVQSTSVGLTQNTNRALSIDRLYLTGYGQVRRLLLENVGKYAHQVDIDSFRARFADPDVQVILVKKRRWLLGKFREYCAADGTQAATSDQAKEQKPYCLYFVSLIVTVHCFVL